MQDMSPWASQGSSRNVRTISADILNMFSMVSTSAAGSQRRRLMCETSKPGMTRRGRSTSALACGRQARLFINEYNLSRRPLWYALEMPDDVSKRDQDQNFQAFLIPVGATRVISM